MYQKSSPNPSQLNIYQKLAKIRKPAEVIRKNKAGYGYRYVSEDAILALITGGMNKLNVSLIPRILPGTSSITPHIYEKHKYDKNTKQLISETVCDYLFKADMEWMWVNNDQPDDRIIVPWTVVGQQSDASQAFGSGLTYSSRYFMLKYFNIATSEDDPDSWRAKQREAEEAEQMQIARAIIDEVNLQVNQHLAKNESDRAAISQIIRKHARDDKNRPSSNYYLIVKPDIARSLMKELQAFISPDEGGVDSGS